MQVLNSKRTSGACLSTTPDCSPPSSSVADSNDIAGQQLASTIGTLFHYLLNLLNAHIIETLKGGFLSQSFCIKSKVAL